MGLPFVMFNLIEQITISGADPVNVFADSVDTISYRGTPVVPGEEATVGDTIRITGTGSVECVSDGASKITFAIFFPPQDTPIGTIQLPVGNLGGKRNLFFEFLLTYQGTYIETDDVWVVEGVTANGVALIGAALAGGAGNLTTLPKYENIDSDEDNRLKLTLELAGNLTVVVDQCVIEYLYTEDGSYGGILEEYLSNAETPGQTVEAGGSINSVDPRNTLAIASSYTAVLSSSKFYAATWYAATAFHDLGTINNTQSATFTYEGAEGGGGVAVGLRWSDLGQQGDFAFIDTNSSPPVIGLQEMLGGWVAGSYTTSSSLTLSTGNSYTLTIVDDGTTVTASLTDDVGLQTCSFTAMAPAGNTEVMFGWVGLDPDFSFEAPITQVLTSSVATPTISPPAGNYALGQTVPMTTATSGASIYYTTDGSTPTTGSTEYTGPITVGTSETVKAIAALTGWANSAVASAAYAIAAWTMEYGTIDGISSGTLSLTGRDRGMLSSSAVYAGIWAAATAYRDLGTNNNTTSATFIYRGPEAGGGVAVGLRWNDSTQEGDFVYLNTNSTPPVLTLYEMGAGWSTGITAISSSLNLTVGSSYTIVISDNGTTVTGSLIDDVGPQSCSFTATLTTANTQVMFGWVGLLTSYTFITPITGLATTIVATPTFSPSAGSYTTSQSVTISTSTTGAAIYYTTDGSTPTTASNLYTGAITVAAAATINAVGVLAGWTNSFVGSAAYTIAPWTMEYGTIDGHTSGNIALTGADTGTLSATTVYAGTWYAATAWQDLGTSGNTISASFTYQGVEGGGGIAVGVRWNDSTQEGDFAFINTNASPPVVALQELTSGWTAGTSAASSSLTLTIGNSYVLTLFDDGVTVTASLTDDTGPQSCSITPTLSTSNTEVLFGWIGLTASFPFGAVLTGVVFTQTPTVATPTLFPVGGTYIPGQSVTIATATPGAAIYYTTDGSTPTSSSTLYTGAITVSSSQVVKAIGILAGWANSAVASAFYTISGASAWYDTYSGSGTLDAHTPNIGSGGYTLVAGGSGTVGSGGWTPDPISNSQYSFDPGVEVNTLTQEFVWQDGTFILFTLGGDGTFQILPGSPPTLQAGSPTYGPTMNLPLVNGTAYTLNVVDNGVNLSVTCNGVTATAPSTSHGAGTVIGIDFIYVAGNQLRTLTVN